MRIGSLFSGAGGLDMAVQAVFGGEVSWHCENDPAASKVLAHRWPGIPNYEDITNTDWYSDHHRVEPVDVLCGGWPCQPFSLAGKQKGINDERALWPYVARAVRALRPRYVVLENVSAVLRSPEFTRVANSLAEAGYDFRWTSLRASDVGAPHRRERLFVVATDTEIESRRVGHGNDVRAGGGAGRHPQATRRSGDVADSSGDGRDEGRPEPAGLVRGSDASLSGDGAVELLPTPAAWDGQGGGGRQQATRDTTNGKVLVEAVRELLPTPTSRDHKGANQRQDETCLHGALLPTPSVADGMGGHMNRSGDRRGELLLPGIAKENAWGKYAPAIRRWEQLTRPAPSPTEPNTKGNPRLSARFSEWMMGWPDGWVTDLVLPNTDPRPDKISRNDALRIIGNGVVPQQAVAALRWLLDVAQTHQEATA